MIDKSKFLQAYKLNVNKHTEEKNGLTYLSWAWAWYEFKKIYPDATYRVIKFENENGVKLPYMYDKETGYIVCTEVNTKDETLEMWLPVMDNRNNAMKSTKYKTNTRYPQDVEPATMTDINKALMRCLTKNLAMFGLGLYIYAGEDLPSIEPIKIDDKEIEKFLLECDDIKLLSPFFKKLSTEQQDTWKQNFTNVKEKINETNKLQ